MKPPPPIPIIPQPVPSGNPCTAGGGGNGETPILGLAGEVIERARGTWTGECRKQRCSTLAPTGNYYSASLTVGKETRANQNAKKICNDESTCHTTMVGLRGECGLVHGFRVAATRWRSRAPPSVEAPEVEQRRWHEVVKTSDMADDTKRTPIKATPRHQTPAQNNR